MGRDPGSRFDARRTARLIGPVAAIIVCVAALIPLPEVFATFPSATRARYAGRFLWMMLVVYWAMLFWSVIGGAVLGVVVLRARRARMTRPVAARLLLLCVATLFGLVVMEAASAVWLSRLHRFPRLPTDLPRRSEDEVRIAVIGGSSAEGSHYQEWISIGRIVAWKLQPALPGRRVTADVLAEGGALLENMHRKLKGIEHRPDVLIIYSGHNEFQSRFTWNRDSDRVGGPSRLLPGAVLGNGAGSPFGRLVSEVHDKYCLMAPPELDRHALIDPPIARRAEYDRIVADFGRRLEAIVTWSEQVGIVPVLVIPPGNEAGFEPNRSVLTGSPFASEAGRRAFARDFQAARESESDPPRALARYRALLARHPGFAETHFRLARLLEQSERWDEANRHYIRARDLDGFPQRCPEPFQAAYRRVAARHGCILIDGPAELRAISPHGILDDHLFNDGHHPSLQGHVALAAAVLRALRARKAFGWSRGPAPAIDPVECATHFGIDPKVWAKVCKESAFFYSVTAGNRYDPAERLAKANRYREAAGRITTGTAPRDLGIPGIGIRPVENSPSDSPPEQPRAFRPSP